MSDSKPELERLADEIGELKSIDWQQATRDSGLEPDTAICENLRVLSQIASFDVGEVSDEDGPRQWGPFEILERLSVDEEGERWSARTESGREIEVLWPPSHHHDPAHARAELISAARAMVGTRHPHLVEVMGADAFEGRMGIWMQATPGLTLEEHRVQSGPLTGDRLLALGRALCQAVDAVHTRGRFVHALPPSGVLVHEEGGARLRRLPQLRSATELRAEEKLPALSAYHFAAPESLRGAAPTRASDVFAIAALLTWAAGQDEKLAQIDAIGALREHRAHPRRVDGLPPRLAELLGECLREEASLRPATPDELQRRWESAAADLGEDDWRVAASPSLWRRILRRPGRS